MIPILILYLGVTQNLIKTRISNIFTKMIGHEKGGVSVFPYLYSSVADPDSHGSGFEINVSDPAKNYRKK